MKRVALFTKPGCGLRDRVEDAIRGVQRHVAFEFVEINILDDSAFCERCKNDIPVILLDGREIARHRISPRQL